MTLGSDVTGGLASGLPIPLMGCAPEMCLFCISGFWLVCVFTPKLNGGDGLQVFLDAQPGLCDLWSSQKKVICDQVILGRARLPGKERSCL